MCLVELDDLVCREERAVVVVLVWSGEHRRDEAAGARARDVIEVVG